MLLKGELQHMAASEMEAMVDRAAMDRVKATDPHPTIRVYRIAEEGDASGSVVVGGRKTKSAFHYLRDAISKLHEHTRIGTKLFRGHNADNSHDGRVRIGEVVGTKLAEIGGKLQAFAAAYIYPQFAGDKLDVASVEAPFRFTMDGDAVRVTDFEDVTGIAVANASEATPGFAGATLLGVMQMFAEEGRHTVGITLDQIREAMKSGELSIKPSDLFDEKALLDDNIVHNKVSQTGFEAARRVRDQELKSAQQELEGFKKQIETLTQERDQARVAVVHSKRDSVFGEIAETRKLSDPQRQFIARNWDRMKSEAKDDAGFKADIENHVVAQLKEFDEVGKLFGAKPDGEPSDKGAPAGDDNGKNPFQPDYYGGTK